MEPALTAQQTIDRARIQLESGRSASLPELIKLIEALSVDLCKVTIGDLAELIEKDGVVLTRILSVANKLAHNPGIAPIATLSQAIHQIGFNRVRNIAVSLMLMDKSDAGASQEQRDASTLTLAAGLIAQGAAEFTGTHDPEFVFACASLRNIGRILMAAISPQHYREAIELNRKEPELDGFRRRFGIPVTELSRRLLASSKLPEDVTKALRDGEPESFNSVATSYNARLFGLCDYGHKLASLTMDTGEPDDGFVRKVTLLSRRFNRLIAGSEEIAKPAMLFANETLRSFTRCSGVTGLPSAGLSRIRQRLEAIAPGAAPEAEKPEVLPVGSTAPGAAEAAAEAERAAAAAPAAPAPAAAAAADDASRPPAAVEEPAPEEISAPAAPAISAPASTSAAPWDASLPDLGSFGAQSLADAGPTSLEMARDAVGAVEAWLFCRVEGTSTFRVVEGLGPMSARLPQKPSLRDGERTVFGVCLKRREVVLIHDTSERALSTYLPPWWADVTLGVKSFVLMPIADRPEIVDTLLFFGWPEKRRVQLARGHISLLQRLFAKPKA